MISYAFRAITGTSPLQKTLRRHFGRVPLVPEILAALERVRRGKVEHVGRSGKRRNHLKKT